MSRIGAANREGPGAENEGAAQNQRREEGAWGRIRARLRAELGEDVFNSWFARVDYEGEAAGVVRLSAPTLFLKGWIRSHYNERLLDLWRGEVEHVRRVDVVQRSALRVVAVEDAPSPARRPPDAAQPAGFGGERDIGSPLDARLTFATFCEGRSNDVAARAARAVAAPPEAGAPLYNPLYIHAGVGLGKTHILHAIAHEARGSDPRRRVLYLTVERFVFQFVASFKDRSTIELKERLRAIDLLLIDDMQFLTGKAVQQEFCHMLNALLDSARQVVVAADRPPSDLEGLDERVCSRLKGGVVVGVGAPDLALRRRILDVRLAAARERNPRLAIPSVVLDHVAGAIATNGRDLDGALNRLICRADLASEPITVELAGVAIADLVSSREPRRIMIEDIQKVVARHYNVSRNDLLSERRTRIVVRPRQIAMYLAKTMTPRSFPEIGKRFGGRDHTTVLHAVRKIEELAAADAKLAQEIEFLRRLIQE